MKHNEKRRAVGYLRTSSATNVGLGKDSERRQREAIQAHAKAAGFEIVAWFYDEAVSGADPVHSRPGFAAMLERVAADEVATIIVETANRFARDLMVQEVGFTMLRGLGVTLIAADSPGSFQDDTPTAKLIRQVLGAVSEFEKAMLVAKLKGARDRKRAGGVKVEGRKSHVELDRARVELAKRLHRYPLKGGKRRSLREIAAEMAAQGHLGEGGKPFAAMSIKRMLEAELPKVVAG